MTRFTAEMKHNAETIGRLVETQQRTFQFGRRIVQLLLSVALIAYGIYADKSMFTPYLAMLAGCILLTGMGTRAKVQTQRLLKEMNGSFPQSSYTFSDRGFTFYEKGDLIGYDRLCRLIEDREYLYLYISTQSAYMVDRATVSGGGCDGLKQFLKEKTGLDWGRPNSLLTFSLRSLMQPRKHTAEETHTTDELRSLERERTRRAGRHKK